jgi:hypothetical protein
MKLTVDRPYADPAKAARTLIEIANANEPVQDGRVYIEKINGHNHEKAVDVLFPARFWDRNAVAYQPGLYSRSRNPAGPSGASIPDGFAALRYRRIIADDAVGLGAAQPAWGA